MDPMLVAAILTTISYIASFLLLLLAMHALLNLALPRVSPSLKFFVLLAAVDLFFFGISSSIWLSLTIFKPPAAAGLVSYAEYMSTMAVPIGAANVLGFFAETCSYCATGRSLGADLRGEVSFPLR